MWLYWEMKKQNSLQKSVILSPDVQGWIVEQLKTFATYFPIVETRLENGVSKRMIWLVGCFGFNGPLRQYFSLYRAVSQREGEREEKDRWE